MQDWNLSAPHISCCPPGILQTAWISVSSREGPRLLFRTCLIGDFMETGRSATSSPQVHAEMYEHEPHDFSNVARPELFARPPVPVIDGHVVVTLVQTRAPDRLLFFTSMSGPD